MHLRLIVAAVAATLLVAPAAASADDASLAATARTVERGYTALDRQFERASKAAEGMAEGKSLRTIARAARPYQRGLRMGLAAIAGEEPSTERGRAAQELLLRGGILVDESLTVLVNGIAKLRELKQLDPEELDLEQAFEVLVKPIGSLVMVERGDRMLERGFSRLRAMSGPPPAEPLR